MTEPRLSAASSRLGVVRALERASALVVTRLEVLEARLLAGEEAAWPEFSNLIRTLVAVAQEIAPERRGALLTTGELAERLGCSPKTVLRKKKKGLLTPAMGVGKFLRWRADQVPAGTGNGTVTPKPALGAASYGPGRAGRGR